MKSRNFKTCILALLAAITLFWVPTDAVSQINPPTVNPINGVPTVALPPTGVITNSLLTITVAPGVVFCNGDLTPIHSTQFVLSPSTTYFVYVRCPSEQVFASTVAPIQNVDVSLATITTNLTTVSANTDTRGVQFFPNMSDFTVPFGPGDCAWTTTGTLSATGNGLVNIGASNSTVNQVSVTAAGASNNTLNCNIHLPYRTTAGKGAQLLDCVVGYGVGITNLTSVLSPVLTAITLPAPGTGETASAVSGSAISALTVTPVIGSANLTIVPTGGFFSERIALATPTFLNTDMQVIQLQQVFVQSAASGQNVNTPGGVCHVFQAPI